jgi:hypothetical protein
MMRRLAYPLAAVGLAYLLGWSGPVRADDAAAIIDKAIKAHFPKGLDSKNKGLRSKSKGTLHIMGQDLEYTQATAAQVPSKFKEVMELTVMGQQVKVTTVFDGKQGWINSNGQDVTVTDEMLGEFKEVVYGMGLVQGLFLKDKELKYSLLGEIEVNGKPAQGVKISKEGKRDISIYFDKATGLTAKVEVRRRDFMSGQEVTEERIITQYQDVKDRKVAKKVEVKRDGKPFIEAEVTEVEILEKVEDSEFAKPE